MRKLFYGILLAGCIVLTACGEKNTDNESSIATSAEEVQEARGNESSETKTEGKKKYEHEEWLPIGYWDGTEGVNLDALWEVAGEFAKLDLWQATHVTDEYKEEGTFIWLDTRFYEKKDTPELKFPDNIEEVPEDWRTNGLMAFNNFMGSSNGMRFYSFDDLTFNIESCEKVTINGKDFMREVATVEARDRLGHSDEVRTGKYIAYYFNDEKGSGFVIAGDTSENKNMFPRVEEVLDAIMQSYLPDITGLPTWGDLLG